MTILVLYCNYELFHLFIPKKNLVIINLDNLWFWSLGVENVILRTGAFSESCEGWCKTQARGRICRKNGSILLLKLFNTSHLSNSFSILFLQPSISPFQIAPYCAQWSANYNKPVHYINTRLPDLSISRSFYVRHHQH